MRFGGEFRSLANIAPDPGMTGLPERWRQQRQAGLRGYLA